MDARFHDVFAAEVSKRSGNELVAYLLDAAPTYARVVFNDPMLREDDIKDNIGMLDEKEDDRSRGSQGPGRITPFGCPFCKSDFVCIDDEQAALVRMQCGRHENAGFEHSHRPPVDV